MVVEGGAETRGEYVRLNSLSGAYLPSSQPVPAGPNEIFGPEAKPKKAVISPAL